MLRKKISSSKVHTIHITALMGKFFIMSMEFDKNISDWSYDCTDHKNDIDFFMRLVKMAKNRRQKVSKSDFQSRFSA